MFENDCLSPSHNFVMTTSLREKEKKIKNKKVTQAVEESTESKSVQQWRIFRLSSTIIQLLQSANDSTRRKLNMGSMLG